MPSIIEPLKYLRQIEGRLRRSYIEAIKFERKQERPDIENVAENLATLINAEFLRSARSNDSLIRTESNSLFAFDPSLEQQVLNANKQRIRNMLVRGRLADSETLGLNDRQVAQVGRYRLLLETNNRTDIEDENPSLTERQIRLMVLRFIEQQLKFRAAVIAETEALTTVSQSIRAVLLQAVIRGVILEEDVIGIWNTAGDRDVRESHRVMQGQTRLLNEFFISGVGNLLRYPGDPNAPAEDRVHCRCHLSISFRKS